MAVDNQNEPPKNIDDEVIEDALFDFGNDNAEFANEYEANTSAEADVAEATLGISDEDADAELEAANAMGQRADTDQEAAEAAVETSDFTEAFNNTDENGLNDQDAFFAAEEHSGADTEFASEVAAAPRSIFRDDEDTDRQVLSSEDEESLADGKGLGITALVLSIISLFLWPAVLGPASVILGFMAWGRGSRGLGIWSIAIGLISFLAYIIFLPLM